MTASPKTTAHKAVVAAAVAGLTSFIAALQAHTDLGSMGVLDWIIVIGSAVVAGGTVYVVPNQPIDDTPVDTTGDEPS